MIWRPYKNPKDGEWAEDGFLVLTANVDGSWAVYDRSGKKGSRSSSMANIVGPHGIEAAKQAAENAAKEMSNG